jgi:hypothetical protein
MKKKFGVVILIAVSLFQSCRIVPITNRPQLQLHSEKKIRRISEVAYYEKVDLTYKGTPPLSKEDLIRVGKNMSSAINEYFENHYGKKRISGYRWEFNLSNNQEINAFCYPGGKIIFNTGILPVCQDETGLATVMGHEIAHAIARHANERKSRGTLTTIVLFPVLIISVLATGSTLLFNLTKFGADLTNLGHSRKHEKEADKMGLTFMALAGYNPEKAIDFWERMAAESKGNPPAILSTHPSDKKRITKLKKYLPEALKYYKP